MIAGFWIGIEKVNETPNIYLKTKQIYVVNLNGLGLT